MTDNVEQKVPDNEPAPNQGAESDERTEAADEMMQPEPGADREEEQPEPDAEGERVEEEPESSWAQERARLEAELQAALDEQKRILAMYMRLRADFDNYKRRSAEEMEKLKQTAASDFIIELLPAIDNLERAVEAAGDGEGPLAEGVRLVLRQVHQTLAKAGVEPLPGVGAPFDPQLHEAVAQVPCEDGVEPGTIVDEIVKGYRMGDRILRPSMVRVAG